MNSGKVFCHGLGLLLGLLVNSWLAICHCEPRSQAVIAAFQAMPSSPGAQAKWHKANAHWLALVKHDIKVL